MLLAIVGPVGIARAEVLAAAAPVNGCAFEGFGPAVCTDLPIERGACVRVGETAGLRVTETLTKEGFGERCSGEFFTAFGPAKKFCDSQILAEWCRDTRPEGLSGGRAELCDLESYAGCQLAQRIDSANARVVERACLERSELLHEVGYRYAWEPCKATWEANGVALGSEPGAGAAGSAGQRGVGASSGCGVCAVDASEGARGGLWWLICVGFGLSLRRGLARRRW